MENLEYVNGPNKEILSHAYCIGWERAKKTVGLYARKLEKPTKINSLEGEVIGLPGNWICFGAIEEPWVQSEKDLFKKYIKTEKTKEVNGENLFYFEPKSDALGVAFAQIKRDFQVKTLYSEEKLSGKPNDMILCEWGQHFNPCVENVWIVDNKLFNATYEIVDG